MAIKKPLRKLAVIALVVVVLIFILLPIVNTILENRVKKALETYINTTPGRLYDYEYESVSIDIGGGDAVVRGVKVIPRPNALDSLDKDKLRTVIYLDIGAVILDDIGVPGLLLSKTVDIGLFELDDAKIRYIVNKDVPPGPSSPVVRDIFAKTIKEIGIHEISINNAYATIENVHTPDSIFLRLDSVDLKVKEVMVDKSTVEKVQPFTYENITLFIDRISGDMVHGYDISADSLMADTGKEEIVLRNLNFIPEKFDIKDTTKQFVRNVFLIKAKELRLSQADFVGWQLDTMVRIGHVFVEKPSIIVSMDRHWPKPVHERPLPAKSIRSIPIPLKIDSLTARDGYIFYKEIFTDGKPPLEIYFEDVFAIGSNITNDTLSLSDNPVFSMSGHSKVLGAGLLSFKAKFPVLSPSDTFMMKVKLNAMGLRVLDPIMEGQLKANIKGKLNSMEMDFGADKHRSAGTLAFDYEGLKVEFFRKKTNKAGEGVKRQKFINIIVNPLVRSNNTRGAPNFKTGEIFYERPPDMSFYSILWQSLKSGMASTLMPGSGESKEKKAMQKKEKAGKKAAAAVKKVGKSELKKERQGEKSQQKEKKASGKNKKQPAAKNEN